MHSTTPLFTAKPAPSQLLYFTSINLLYENLFFFHSPSDLFHKWGREREYLMVGNRCFAAVILGRVFCVRVYRLE